MTTRPSNEQIKQQALRANKAAELNEKLRKHISSSFDDLELDQAQTPDRVDQSNWSWLENGSEMYHLVSADDSMLPDLPDETPSPKFNEENQIGLEDSDLPQTEAPSLRQ
ncbi:hypothetical protein Unana1_01991 [Umbelopsis nana]